MASLFAGLPVDVPGTTINRLCGSGLDAIGSAARATVELSAATPNVTRLSPSAVDPNLLSKPEQDRMHIRGEWWVLEDSSLRPTD
jgi:hypothetical protein